MTILKYKDWLVKSASKKQKKTKMKTVLQTQQLKNHDDFCALNQDLPTIRPINYQKSCSIKTFLSSPNAIYQNQHQTKSISALPLAYTLLLQDCQ